MTNFYGCSSGKKYNKYSSSDTEINLTMNYIPGWLYSEHRGSYGSYAQVLFYEPDKKDNTRKAGIAVNVQDISKVEFSPATIDAMAKDIVDRRMKFKDAKVLKASKGKVSGMESLIMEFYYKTLEKLYSVDAKLIPVKERVYVFRKGDKFYTVRYENLESGFDKYNNAFSHIIKTIKFKD